jgi:hypothetical protein
MGLAGQGLVRAQVQALAPGPADWGQEGVRAPARERVLARVPAQAQAQVPAQVKVKVLLLVLVLVRAQVQPRVRYRLRRHRRRNRPSRPAGWQRWPGAKTAGG